MGGGEERGFWSQIYVYFVFVFQLAGIVSDWVSFLSLVFYLQDDGYQNIWLQREVTGIELSYEQQRGKEVVNMEKVKGFYEI